MENIGNSTDSADTNVLGGYIDRPTLARQLDRTQRTLARWEEIGIGPPITRIGSMVVYRVDSVRTWLESLEHGRRRRASGR